jgi:hypothetical protein
VALEVVEEGPRCFATCLCVALLLIGLPRRDLLVVTIEGLICLFVLSDGGGREAEQSETAFDRGLKVLYKWRPCGELC